MNHRPYPNPDRARHQLARGRVVRRRTALAGTVAYLESDEYRARMRRIGFTAAEFVDGVRASLGTLPRWSDIVGR